ncbi:MAG: glycosyltransferase, partial [Armatimonadetes bacterium]|nr:glycosyltransferase [Armatimonadota bacterium]
PVVFAAAYPGYKDPPGNHIYRFRSLAVTKKADFPLALPFSLRLESLIPKLGLSIIHAHHPFLLGDVACRFSKKLNIPLVFTFHTQYEQYTHYFPLPQGFLKRLTRKMVTQYAEKCDCILLPAPSIGEVVQKYGITRRVERIPNAVDLSAFENTDGLAVRRRFGLTTREKVLVFVGRLAKEKNLEFLLDAFKMVVGNYSTARLLMVGGGPQEKALREYAVRLGLLNEVIFAGMAPYSEIRHFYGASDVLVMTSTTEVKPLALLEAMASGVPIVAVTAHGASDTVTHEENGILTPLSTKSFSEGVLRVLWDDRLREKLAEGALASAAQYSVTRIAGQVAALYEDLIAGKRRNTTKD